MHRSKLRIVYNKTKSIEAWETFKKQRNTCVSIERKNIRNHFSRLTEGHFQGSRDFWGAIKPFLNSKSVPKSQKIMLNKNETVINDSFEVTNIMNNYFVNVVENTTWKKPRELACDESGNISQATLIEIIDTYQDHESIKTIKSFARKGNETFEFQHATANDLVEMIKTLDKNTSIGIDDVPPKLIILASHVISGPLSDLINLTLIGESIFPSVEKLLV